MNATMNITTTYRNETAGQVLHVVTDQSGIWFETAEVLSISDDEMGRPGNPLNSSQAVKLLAYWDSAGHSVKAI